MIFSNSITHQVYAALRYGQAAITSEITAKLKLQYKSLDDKRAKKALAAELRDLVYHLLLPALGLPLVGLEDEKGPPTAERLKVDGIHELAGDIIRASLTEVDWNQLAEAIVAGVDLADCDDEESVNDRCEDDE
jgi:hypothetical protein